MAKLSPSIRVSGGTPAGMPDFKPVGPTGLRAMLRPSRPALFQVWVDTPNGSIPVGPKCPQHAAFALADAIEIEIGRGRERTWSNPRVAPIGILGHG